jgi:hypothetical protein
MEVIKDEFIKLFFTFGPKREKRTATIFIKYIASSLIECPPATIPGRDMGALKEAETRCSLLQDEENSDQVSPYYCTYSQKTLIRKVQIWRSF